MNVGAPARHVLCDLDDTLYAYPPCEEAAIAALSAAIARDLGIDAAAARAAWSASRKACKTRVEGTGSSHNRLLYAVDVAHALGTEALPIDRVRGWERAYWTGYLSAARLRPRVLPFLEALRARGAKLAIVTDLTIEPQLAKIEHLGLAPFVSALAVSEEVERDKPDPAIFRLAAARLGVAVERCVMVGDNDAKDGQGARRLGIPFFFVDPKEPEGAAFDAITKELWG